MFLFGRWNQYHPRLHWCNANSYFANCEWLADWFWSNKNIHRRQVISPYILSLAKFYLSLSQNPEKRKRTHGLMSGLWCYSTNRCLRLTIISIAKRKCTPMHFLMRYSVDSVGFGMLHANFFSHSLQCEFLLFVLINWLILLQITANIPYLFHSKFIWYRKN